MSGTREVGRYNLHRLGWSAFEDLCIHIMRIVLGETCTRFPAGTDGGRDGWFSGAASGQLLLQDQFEGAFILQCKHSSRTRHTLTLGDLSEELKKVKELKPAAKLQIPMDVPVKP